MSIFKDIKSGALPRSELLSFLFWWLGKTFWLWFILIVAGVIMLGLR